MKVYKYVFFIMLFFLYGTAFAENVYFSCETGKGNVLLLEDEGVVKYQIEKDGRPEFTFQSKLNVNSGFSYNHYSRFQTDYFYVSFVNKGYKYTVFSNYEDGQYNKGVIVLNLKSKKESTYQCNVTSVDRLSELSSKVRCDKDSALGC